MPQPDPSPPAATPRRFRWRRLFQFRLRTLLIVTTIVAIALGWWSYKARQQREAVAALEKLTASVEYDTSLPWTGGMEDPPKWPKWLLYHVDYDYFARVTKIDFFLSEKIADSGLEYLASMTALRRLSLTWKFWDASVEQDLYIRVQKKTQVSDAGLKYLTNLTALQELSLDNTTVSDAGLEHLKNLKALQSLFLRNTQVTDAGLEHLKSLATLQLLRLEDTRVTDAGIASLKKSLPNCKISH